jgi:metal-responsive CopG/Arc/MetJ family transcriptional regulator
MGLPEFTIAHGTEVMHVDAKVRKVRPYVVCGIVRDIDLDDDQEDEIPEEIPEEIVEEVPVPKKVPENSELTNAQKVKAIKRALENKINTLTREKAKVRDWRSQAIDRNEKATTEFEKRKTELEELIKKSEDRFNKRIAKTQKFWIEYSDNYEVTKIKGIEQDIALLQAELDKLQENVPVVA